MVVKQYIKYYSKEAIMSVFRKSFSKQKICVNFILKEFDKDF